MADTSDILRKYFPMLSDAQAEQFRIMGELYPEWNARINVISRKDIDNLFNNHILHSLSLAAFFGPLADGTSLLDMGTGGGFPGIPLAVMYPKCKFHLVDRIGKKLRVAEEIARAAGINNVTFRHGDIGECHDKFEYVVSRAVTRLDVLVKLTARNVKRNSVLANRYSPGIVALKGGDIEEESAAVSYPVIEFPINEFFSEPFFDTKKIVYVPVGK